LKAVLDRAGWQLGRRSSRCQRRWPETYGMNFEHMPELKWEYGYYMVVGAILSICGVLYARFRRNGWL
jgi:hypothetical protein